jgi:hypothetical protein
LAIKLLHRKFNAMELPKNVVPMPAEQRARLKQMAQAATDGPWAYRSQEFDDWGVVRGPLREDGHRVHLAKVTAPYASQEQMQAHREAKTDPYEANGQYIAAVSPDVALATLAYVEALEAEVGRLGVESNVAREQVLKVDEDYQAAAKEITKLSAQLAEARQELADQEVELLQMAEANLRVQAGKSRPWMAVAVKQLGEAMQARPDTNAPVQLGTGLAFVIFDYLRRCIEADASAPSPSTGSPAADWFPKEVFESKEQYDASVESVVARIKLGEAQAIERENEAGSPAPEGEPAPENVGPWTGCWYNSSCPCAGPAEECPCYIAPENEPLPAAATLVETGKGVQDAH